MQTEFESQNNTDKDGNPSGGYCQGIGIRIDWQNGPLGRGETRKEPNGAFVETIIAMVLQRVNFYQTASKGKFACDENRLAISHLRLALNILMQRTADREKREVEGTHGV